MCRRESAEKSRSLSTSGREYGARSPSSAQMRTGSVPVDIKARCGDPCSTCWGRLHMGGLGPSSSTWRIKLSLRDSVEHLSADGGGARPFSFLAGREEEKTTSGEADGGSEQRCQEPQL